MRMNNLLFTTLAVTATSGFLLGVIGGYFHLLIASLVLAGLFVWLSRKIA